MQTFHYWTTALVVAFMLYISMAVNAHVAWAEETDDAPSSPTLVQPTDALLTTGSTHPANGVPTFIWDAVPGASNYRVQVSASAGFSNFIIDQTTYVTSFTPLVHLADGQYYWRVQAYQDLEWGPYSETRTFIKDWSDNGQIRPILLSPEADSMLAEFTFNDFSWEAVPGAAVYLFEIGVDLSLSTVIYSATTLRERHTPLTRLKNDKYYWRVTPLDNQRNAGRSSEVRTFNYDWDLAPQLLEPANLIETPFTPQFAWTAVKSAHSYQLEISTQSDFSAPDVYITHLPQYSPEKALSNDQDYYWRVKAIDYVNNSTSWSNVRQFRRRWDFQAQLLTPPNNSIHQSYPFFSWTPIPGIERYGIQVDESTSFANPIMDVEIFNATSTSLTKMKDRLIQFEKDYYWRVRGIDAQGYHTPWSNEYAFRFGSATSPNLVYPAYYYRPDTDNLTVHSDATIAWPLFVWDVAFKLDTSTLWTHKPDYYEITVSNDPGFQNINFQIETSGIAIAPTLENPFTGLVDGQIYYWRVRAMRGGKRIGIDSVWLTRVDRAISQLPFATTITPIYPANAFEAVETPPILGWQPIEGAANYRVEISRDPGFATVVDSAEPQFLNYVPWQGRREQMPFGRYWWRIRAESGPGIPLGDWSAARSFNLSFDVVTSNPYDFVPPLHPNSILSVTDTYSPTFTLVSPSTLESGDYALGNLHIMLNRVALRPLANSESGAHDNLNWAIAFEAAPSPASPVQYGIYIDIDHQDNSGATSDPLGKPIPVNRSFLPEYALYINRTTDTITAGDINLFTWTGGNWSPAQSLDAIGGDAWYDSTKSVIQLLTPYTAIGAGSTNFSGSMAITIFSTDGTPNAGILDAVPLQGAEIDNPVFISDMVMPLYPFDTPASNPIIHDDLPSLRWRMPYFDSVDGYEIQIARDIQFTDLVETWGTSESQTSFPFSWIPTAFHSLAAYEDNESYYWRVRIRHERYTIREADFDYGPWSPAMRFKLDSRQVSNPTLSTGPFAGITPTFSWDRVEGAAGYKIQIDDDATFNKPVINKSVDDVSYTPMEALPDGTYYWRVAMRRSDKVIGHWTSTMTFQKSSITPVPIAPINNVVINQQPTFRWEPVFIITGTNRIAVPQYQIQIDNDPNFGSPVTYKTTIATFTLSKAQSLEDGNWYWRVATIDAKKNLGTYSTTQQFYKEYTSPQLIAPAQGDLVDAIAGFEWTPIEGAAAYEIQFATDAQFNGALKFKTDNTRFSPTVRMTGQEYYWRVRMIDDDNKAGPFNGGRISVIQGETIKVFLPAINKP